MTKKSLLSSSKKNSNDSNYVVCGVDEAGRGPVFGPLVLCGVVFTSSNLPKLVEIGVKDSKKLTPKKREEFSGLIKKSCQSYKCVVVSPLEIDARLEKKISLNRLEEIKIAEILNALIPEEIYIDAVDVNEARFGESIKKLLNYKPKKIVSEHKADDTYPVVSAASILAKVERDAHIRELQQKFGDLGSGYTSDQKTIDFLRNWIKEHKKAPPFARTSWDTVKKMMDQEMGNKKITDYFK